MKALIGNAFLVGLAVATASVVACSSGSSVSNPGSNNPAVQPNDSTGTIGMKLTLPGGVVLKSVSYTINAAGGAIIKSGTVNIQNSTVISFLVGGVPAGAGYTITLTSTDDAGTSCIGKSLPFTVVARTTTNVTVQLICSSSTTPTTGQVQVNGIITDCATYTFVATSPSETTIGNSVQVAVGSEGPNSSGLTYTASAPSGTFDFATGSIDATNGATFNYTCTQPGTFTIALAFGDGPIPAGGATCTAPLYDATLNSTTVTVTCDGDAGVGPVDSGTTVVDSGTTVVDSGTTVVDSGTTVVDSGTTVVDSGTTVVDSGTTVVDSGTTVVDSGPLDSGTSPLATALAAYKQYNPATTALTETATFFANKDIARGDVGGSKYFTGTGTPPAGFGFTCLNCATFNDCLDNTVDKVAGNECQDLTGVSAGGAKAGTTRDSLCIQTLTCISGSSPNCASTGEVDICYCGAANGGARCNSIAQGTGPCAQTEADALELPITSVSAILSNFTTQTLGGGAANQIYTCLTGICPSFCF